MFVPPVSYPNAYELYTDFTVDELLAEFDSINDAYDTCYNELKELQGEIEWADNFDPEECEDEDEWNEFERKDAQLDDLRGEVHEMEAELEEIEYYLHQVQKVVERVCGRPKYFVLTSNNQYISGPYYTEPRNVKSPQKVVKVYPNSILMSEQILEEERNARQR